MADLHGTYDYRIKLTIDNAKIDSNLAWIPITVLLTSTAGEEVFVEFDADADFDRVAFTKADESTQLYADCEKFDDSAQIAIYHVSRDGWAVASGADTDFYMYYDNDAGHNTTYISKSGGTAAQSVYDANFKGVWHLNDAIPDYDTKYEASVEPDSDGWTLGGTDYASVSSGILTIDTSGNDTYTCFYYKSPNVDFDAGFYLKTRVKTNTDMNPTDDRVTFRIRDGTQNERVVVGIRKGDVSYLYDGDNWGTFALDTTTAYVVYEIYVKGTTFWIYADGVQKATNTVDAETTSDIVLFGDDSASIMCKAEIDYVYYALNEAVDPTILRAIDSTSNAQHGTKINIDKPPDAVGKVGQAQHFNPSDTAIEIPDQTYYRNPATLEHIFKQDTYAQWRKPLFQGDDGGNYWSLHTDTYIEYIWDTIDNGGDKVTVNGTTDLSGPDTNWHYFVGTRTATNLIVYMAGAEEANSGDNDDLQDLTHAYAMQFGRRKNAINDDSYFDGLVDETRISDSVRTAAWIKATYNTLWDSLLTYGAEEEGAGAVANAIFFGCNQ